MRSFGETADEFLNQARAAYQKRNWAEAVRLLDKALAADRKLAGAYQLRGQAQFMRGKFKESVADFDHYLKLEPGKKAEHWQRGISLYYLGKYAEGRDQFKLHETVNPNDVENAVWHFLCVARKDGVAKARAGMIKIGKDRRVPMMEVDDLFRGKLKPSDVLAAAEAGEVSAQERKSRLFYAHLYLGLYHDATGDKKKALEHTALAAGKYRLPGYMGEVARIHAGLLRSAGKKK
jgi:lipoprotein NlpI